MERKSEAVRHTGRLQLWKRHLDDKFIMAHKRSVEEGAFHVPSPIQDYSMVSEATLVIRRQSETMSHLIYRKTVVRTLQNTHISPPSVLEIGPDMPSKGVDLLALARGLQSGIMTPEQVLSLLDFHASRTFPYTGKLHPDAAVSRPIGCRSTESRSVGPTTPLSRLYTTKDEKVQRLVSPMGDGRIYTKMAKSQGSTTRLDLDRATYGRSSPLYDPLNGQFIPRPGQAHVKDAPPV
ncbi:hypothetical protein T265_00420 [Opisthorchis viverrini]|uniref:Uncharacterized protein n=1 Tax=Opisthorchis viverrini TaxID=6198 RepID=A0A075A205_OPIVI|nr:hypothetical protein T265_00420 [Opisthorchis viverrini]KER33733.1 hypothetical protein T265_00420 [Opisthorchis viverrini]